MEKPPPGGTGGPEEPEGKGQIEGGRKSLREHENRGRERRNGECRARGGKGSE